MLPKEINKICKKCFPGLVVINFLQNEVRIFASGSRILQKLFSFELRITETFRSISRSGDWGHHTLELFPSIDAS